MHEVTEVPFGIPCKTKLWFSGKVMQDIRHRRELHGPDGHTWKRLRRFSQNGFWNYMGGNWPPIKHEREGVYRIGVRESLFRIIGFFETDQTSDFIGIDTLDKGGQKLDRSEQARIDDAIRVKKNRLWRKATNGPYPRIAG